MLEAVTRPPGGTPSTPQELARAADGRFLVPQQLSAGGEGTFVLTYYDTAEVRVIQDSDRRIVVVSPDGRHVDRLTPAAMDPPPVGRDPAIDGQGRVLFATATRDARFGTYELIVVCARRRLAGLTS